MYLQSLELQGFKSFPDKIKLTFDKGLTAVVGPNGSGKSNIGDAVRWVLGEQSTKTLRGNKMEDVIFSGTKTRKPMGFAAVTLEINNATGELGEEYGAVVSVTRKLYRSGDSEYRINGKSVRLKDVTELFMDTGMGRDGYAIIGQGRIAEIVSAKNTDRRDIFEEAAGVSKFRYKKQEAQRKLDGAQENLVRLLDIVAELEARVEPLRKQAEKAKQYVELAGQQKQLEVSLWVRRLTALREKLTALSDGCLQAQAEYQNAEREVQRADTQVQEGYRKMQESTLHMEELRQKLREADQETANLQSAIAVCENEVVHSEGAIAELERQMALIAEQSEAAENQFLVLQKRQAELEQRQEKLQAQSGEVEQRWKSLEQAAAQQGEACEKSSARMQRLLMQQSELRVMQETAAGQQQELRAQITEHAMRCHALGQAKETQQSAYQTAEQQAAQAAETLQQVQNRRDGFQRRYANSVQALENGKKQQEQAAFALREKRQRQKLLQDMERNMEGFAGSVKSVLRADGGKPHGVFGTVAQLITTNSRYGVALETALGGAMQNLVVADENAAKQWIRHLAKNRAGRATFLPLTSVRGRTLTESGLERHEGFRIVTLDGQIINAGGSFTGGSAQRSGGMLTRRAELDSLAAAIQTLEEQEAQASAALEKAKQQSRQLQQQMEALQDECRRAESASLAANAQVEKFYYVQQQAAERLEEAQQQHSACQQRLRETEQSLRTAQEKAVQTAKELEQVQQSIQQEGDKRQALQQQQEELAQQRAELKIQLVSLEKDREQLAESLSQQTQAQHSMEQRLAQTRADIAAQNGKIVQKKQQAQENRARLEQLKTESKTNAEQIQHWQQVHDTQDQNIRQIQAGLREINDSREKISGEISRLEERKIAVQSDYDGVVRQLMEQYELSVSEAQQAAQPLEDLQAAQRELQSLKAKIRALGTVNVAAISEYEEVFARYQFLTAQVQDAQKAKQELEDLIESLTTEMQRIFSESFSIINRNFQEIFRELFGGGEARLELTDPEQVLESGIEIKVAPPGKVIKNLISLSGGEQSFVAIAIYFAILRLRPSPFCILDEIDAALDEGNVRKYAQYLRNFTDTTQFILVTHRRSAMEEANVLYGVTMQEDGVSRLLRMEQEEFAGLEESAAPRG